MNNDDDDELGFMTAIGLYLVGIMTGILLCHIIIAYA